MKIWEQIVEARLRQDEQICEQQYILCQKRALDPDAIFAPRLLIEKYKKRQKELFSNL